MTQCVKFTRAVSRMNQHGGGFYGYQTSGNMSSSRTTGNYQRPYGQPADAFTAEMRDRQARGKDPYQESGDSSDANHWVRSRRSKEEPFVVVEQRRVAAEVLDNPELLMMHAQRDNDSIAATRLRYTRMLCGVGEPAQSSNQHVAPSKSSSSSHHHHHHHHSAKSRGSTPSKRHSSGVDRSAS